MAEMKTFAGFMLILNGNAAQPAGWRKEPKQSGGTNPFGVRKWLIRLMGEDGFVRAKTVGPARLPAVRAGWCFMPSLLPDLYHGAAFRPLPVAGKRLGIKALFAGEICERGA